ncbi:MAG: VWA domain-containing protein [Lachnospiraceae bacterium]|nr:VWA domain-containing protein [Lachnospiraceae bacterium]
MERIDYVYIIVDNSNSMLGNKIGSVNDAINNILFRLRKIQAKNDVSIQMIQMSFAKSVVWSNVFPVPLSQFVYNDLYTCESESNMGTAFKELYEKLERQYEVTSTKDSETTILLFSDGLYSDDVYAGLSLLKKNPIFKTANRIGITFHDDLSEDLAEKFLAEYVSGSDNIVIDDFGKLNRLLFEKYR